MTKEDIKDFKKFLTETNDYLLFILKNNKV